MSRRGHYDVVYATGLLPQAVAGARLARRPIVAKVVGDPAWERARRLKLTEAGFEEFQREAAVGWRVRAMRGLRSWSVRHATSVTAPSVYLAQAARAWLGGPAEVSVIPNGVRISSGVSVDHKVRDRKITAIHIGRLLDIKRVDVLLDAMAATSEVILEIIGDGPERSALESRARALRLDSRVHFTGPVSHEEVMRRLALSDLLLLASIHEGFPHVAIEALACGVPVVAPAVGGIPEVVRDGVNGLILETVTPESYSQAFRHFLSDPMLRKRLASRARHDAERWRLERCVEQLEALLVRAVHGKPKAVLLGKGGPSVPLTKDLESKLEIFCRLLDPKIVTVGRSGVRDIGKTRVIAFPALRPPLLGGIVLYILGSAVAVLLAAGRRRAAVICQSPYEGFGSIVWSRVLPGAIRPRIVIEVHGDWRTAARLYGSPTRRVLAPLGDRIASWALRRADRVRVVSRFLGDLVRNAGYTGAIDRFVTYSDFTAFDEATVVPPPAEPRVAFVGALEHSKGIDVLLDAWPMVVRKIPQARLAVAGAGPLLGELRRRIEMLKIGSSVEFLGTRPRSEVMALLDDSSLLVLPSRTEGLPRIIFEAFARGRSVVATSVGGVPELVEHGSSGLLVSPEDPDALAGALVELLGDPDRLLTMGEEGRRRFSVRNPLKEFEAGIARLASWIQMLE